MDITLLTLKVSEVLGHSFIDRWLANSIIATSMLLFVALKADWENEFELLGKTTLAHGKAGSSISWIWLWVLTVCLCLTSEALNMILSSESPDSEDLND